ncbi:MAG: porin [Nitrospirota bacterium]
MKKFLVIIAVLALTVVSSVAMAEVTVSGSIDIRNLSLSNTNTLTEAPGVDKDRNRTTQERVRLNVDAKNDNVKGRVTIEGDWAVWGTGASGNEIPQNDGGLGFREAWIDFTIPGAGPAHVKVGHQFLQLGNGWFFRSGKYGSDAWLVGLPGKNTVAFVDVKLAEGANGISDDTDAYVLLDNFKIDDTKTVGVYFARVNDPRGNFASGLVAGANEANLDTIGLWFNGKLGPINLQAELDYQMGKIKNANPAVADTKFKGNQIVVQANMPIDPLTINATIATGSGDDPLAANEIGNIQTALDKDPHYTFVYEYLSKTACGATNTGFCNTQALNIGAGYKISKNLSVQLDYWMLKANEKVALNGNATVSDDLGSEVDLVVKWNLYDQLSWNWQLGKMMPGDAYNNAAGQVDDIDAIQGVLSYKF